MLTTQLIIQKEQTTQDKKNIFNSIFSTQEISMSYCFHLILFPKTKIARRENLAKLDTIDKHVYLSKVDTIMDLILSYKFL